MWLEGVISKRHFVKNIDVELDSPMQEPRAWVVGNKPDGHLVRAGVANVHGITVDRVVEVVGCVTSTANHPEVVPMKVHGMLPSRSAEQMAI